MVSLSNLRKSSKCLSDSFLERLQQSNEIFAVREIENRVSGFEYSISDCQSVGLTVLKSVLSLWIDVHNDWTLDAYKNESLKSYL